MPTGIEHEHGYVLRQAHSGSHEKGEHDHEPGKNAHEYTLVVGAAQLRRLRSIAPETAVSAPGSRYVRLTATAANIAPLLIHHRALAMSRDRGARLATAKTWRHR